MKVSQHVLELQVAKQTQLNVNCLALFDFTQLHLTSRRKTAFKLTFETTPIIEINWELWTNIEKDFSNLLGEIR